MKIRESSHGSSLEKKKMIYQMDLEEANCLANQPPIKELFYTLEEIGSLVSGLMSAESPTDSNGRILEVRPKGHWFEYEVARKLGYNYPPGSGGFPDIKNQALEVKHHTGKQITVDFGRHHPNSEEQINVIWNRSLKLKVNEIRYLIALAPPPELKVSTIIVLTGSQITKVFGVSPTPTIKYQMGISNKWRSDHKGKMVVGDAIWQTG